ncbi:MAG TPA: ABC transporter substrate-binding protein [Burkholderiaceae bacterium]|nr:ABC transporter substrate-binding protein [Burkholderiaceae bacterium]
MRRSFEKLFARLLLALGAAALVPQAACALDRLPSLRIGLIAPLSGSSGDFGNSMRFGAEMAVNEINEYGGLLGRPVELVTRDDAGHPETGRRVAEDLVLNQRVDFTLGFCNTGVALAALDVFQRANHVLMVPCAQGSAVTAAYPPKDSYVFRLAVSDLMNAEFLASEMVLRRGLTKPAILADQTPYGEGGVRDLTAEFKARGVTPVFVGRFDLSTGSLMAEVSAARKAGADALVVYTVGPGHARAVQARSQLGWRVPYFGSWTLSFRSVLELAGAQALEGTMMTQTIIKDGGTERRSGFISRYMRHSRESRIGSLMAAAQAYDAVHLMLRAVFATKGEPRGPALKSALENLDRSHYGVVTTYTRPFSSTDHEAFSSRMIWMGTWRDGQVQFQYPDDAKLSAMVRRKQ